MFNSFLFRKHSQQVEKEAEEAKRRYKYINKYQNDIRPALLERYGRRVNHFIVKLEEDKKQLYQYRKETERKAFQLLKEIQHKEKYLGHASMRMKDSNDQNSVMTTTDRLLKEKNQKLFQTKYGDQHIAFRSIASQSSYYSTIKSSFRQRTKEKEIHSCNMRFTQRQMKFSKNKKEKVRPKKQQKKPTSYKTDRDQSLNHTNSNKSDDQHLLNHENTFNRSTQDHIRNAEKDESTSEKQRRRESQGQYVSKNNKIYFKQMIDLYQNSKQQKRKKELQQLLVRFGINRIKDLKKQALVETDTLDADLF